MKRITAKQKAFSLIELLVAMAIIAALLALVAFGIATAQRNSRNTQGRNGVSKIKTGLEDYSTKHGRYPTNAEFIRAGNNVNLMNGGTASVVIYMNGAEVPGSGGVRVYCYNNQQGGYGIWVQLEGGTYQEDVNGQVSTTAGRPGGWSCVQ